MRVLVVDALDSFVHIIDQYLRELGADTEVVRSGARTAPELSAWRPDAVVLGPGPGHPADSGHVELVRHFAGDVPLLGVCLGHQAIALAFGGAVRLAGTLMHGRTSVIDHDGLGVFGGLPDRHTVTRYHSIVVAEPLPAELLCTARSTDDGYPMGLRHRELPVEGVQFHPESITTGDGLTMLANFLASVRRPAPR
ncbi:aminodeoxychorismate/anthranilate synthase component II [Streptomyces sp. B-S-A8]|uniref:Aminodeoxychorismate/anthranilate synthase component II n=1 Tax=Streptomyces solicavernae TaxID=3043614 RepID=A0ABT6S0W4_9ACTN|nr:aminodeoxychorismate/anthranilate synthase component II [Streptomyces sp. B-S-A8]MDI3390334.1 aminodeoxychorismate/anthranilate synthase component II [Streptomyces sp. B-S-A8]